MVMILVLFKGESFSLVRGFRLLDLDNRKTFLVDISWISFVMVFLDGDWKVFCFLAFGKLLQDLYFLGIFVLSTGGRL